MVEKRKEEETGMICLEAQGFSHTTKRCAVFFSALMILLCIFSNKAYASGKVEIITDAPDDLRVTNSEGKFIEYGYDEYKPVGDMSIYYNDSEYDVRGEDTGMWVIGTDDSREITFEDLHGKCFEDFYAEIKKPTRLSKIIRALWCEKVTLTRTGIDITAEKGSTCVYYSGVYSPKDDLYYNFDGQAENDISIRMEDQEFVIEGARGSNALDICKGADDNKVIVDRICYMYGGTARFAYRNEAIKAKNAILIPGKTTKQVTGLYLRPSNGGKNMFLSWNKVKGAKSYIVYKYDSIKNEYRKMTVRDVNYLNIPKADAEQGYKYYIQPKSKSDGSGKKVCKRSYPVWAVASGNQKGNVKKVQINKKELRGRKGKTAKLTAQVSTGNEKTALSGSIRWYSSNKKVAKINRKTGKVTFKKRGKCYIWAKAHNGCNSRRILVKVQ